MFVWGSNCYYYYYYSLGPAGFGSEIGSVPDDYEYVGR